MLAEAEKRAAAESTARPGAEGQPGGQAPGAAGQPTPGKPDEPAPGKPGEPAPGGATGALAAGVPEPPKPGIPDEPAPGKPGEPPPVQGPSVKVSGEVRFDSYKAGKVKVTAFDGDHSAHGATPPKVVGAVDIDAPGSFTMVVPQNCGKLYVEAVADEDLNGRPGPLDPQGTADRYPVTVREVDVSGLVVSLTRRDPPPDKGDDF